MDQATLTLAVDARKGNEDAFFALIEQYKGLLYRTALLHMRNPSEAMDMVDEAVYRAWMNIRKLREPAYFGTWLVRILLNACNDRLRKKKRLTLLETTGDVAAPEIKHDDRLDLHAAVDTLEGKLKTVIVLKYFNDMTIDQVARTMEVPLGTAKSYLHRALKRLRLTMEEG